MVIGGYTVFALGDMFIYNRKKKSEWLREKEKRTEEALQAAVKAVNEGTANLKQRVLVKRYEIVNDAEEERIQNQGKLAKALEWVVPGIQGRQSQAKHAMKLDKDILNFLESGEIEKFLGEEEPLKPGNRDVGSINLAGGLLDQKAQIAADAVHAATKRWRSWFWWR